MSDSFISPYGITIREGGVIETVPIVEASFLSKDRELLSLFLIVDSGAHISALPKSDAFSFGINLQSGVFIRISGIGKESVYGWRHIIDIKLKGNSLKLPVVFLDSDNVSRILGREGVFDRFTLIFEESKNRTGFLGTKSNESRKVDTILDQLMN